MIMQLGNTPLHVASENGNEEIVNMLLKANANPSAINQVCFITVAH